MRKIKEEGKTLRKGGRRRSRGGRGRRRVGLEEGKQEAGIRSWKIFTGEENESMRGLNCG